MGVTSNFSSATDCGIRRGAPQPCRMAQPDPYPWYSSGVYLPEPRLARGRPSARNLTVLTWTGCTSPPSPFSMGASFPVPGVFFEPFPGRLARRGGITGRAKLTALLFDRCRQRDGVRFRQLPDWSSPYTTGCLPLSSTGGVGCASNLSQDIAPSWANVEAAPTSIFGLESAITRLKSLDAGNGRPQVISILPCGVKRLFFQEVRQPRVQLRVLSVGVRQCFFACLIERRARLSERRGPVGPYLPRLEQPRHRGELFHARLSCLVHLASHIPSLTLQGVKR